MNQLSKYLPIRKIVTVAIAAGLVWGARRAGMDLGPEAANEASLVIVGLLAGYFEKDPRVRETGVQVAQLVAAVSTAIGQQLAALEPPEPDSPKPPTPAQ